MPRRRQEWPTTLTQFPYTTFSAKHVNGHLKNVGKKMGIQFAMKSELAPLRMSSHWTARPRLGFGGARLGGGPGPGRTRLGLRPFRLAWGGPAYKGQAGPGLVSTRFARTLSSLAHI